MKDGESLSFSAGHPLAKALAKCRLPSLRQLDLSQAGWGGFMITDTNLELLRGAIEGGHLPSLTDLKVETHPPDKLRPPLSAPHGEAARAGHRGGGDWNSASSSPTRTSLG